ncbi:MAG: isoaspartyl peptidase/L-asparaginase [Euryarchaeota archaeon]|nr:isoaspartyl peptidase/L-asparaginase [Euryarchaeota archaeon]
MKLIVHGGAWAIPDDAVDDHLKGVSRAVKNGLDKDNAVDAVEAAINAMENDPTFDAGYGSFLNDNGEIELDAILAKDLRFGAVAGVSRIKNPISLAKKILDDKNVNFIICEGAEEYAETHGIPLCNSKELIMEREIKRWQKIKKEHKTPDDFFHDTVGAVALDDNGNLVAGTSTGGTPNKIPGRVGDSPLFGAGCYADSSVGVSTTGYGESIMRVLLARTVAELVKTKTLSEACKEALITLKNIGGYGGVISLDAKGTIGRSFNTPRMAYAFNRGDKIMSFIET